MEGSGLGRFYPETQQPTPDHCQAPASGGENIKAPRSEIIPPKKGEKVKPAEKSGNDLMHQTCAGAAGAQSSAIKLAAAQQGKEF